jgi:hypothetical protein
MEPTLTTMTREQRLQKLFDDCQQQVLSQVIGTFGLSTAMFKDVDRNGGNVTTLHNFAREDDDYVATDSDKKLHEHSRKKYDKQVRAEYEIKTQENADTAGGKTWNDKRDERIAQSRDEYTWPLPTSPSTGRKATRTCASGLPRNVRTAKPTRRNSARMRN